MNDKHTPDEEQHLIHEFENTILKGSDQYFDEDEFEIIIDHYLKTEEIEPLKRAIAYAERLYPNSLEIRMRRGHLLVALEQYARALDLFTTLHHADPSDTDISYAIAICYSAMGESRKAIKYYQQAAKDGQGLGRIYTNIADEYHNMHRYNDAITNYRAAFLTGDIEADTIYGYTDTSIQDNRVEEAAEFLRSYIDDHPFCAEAWHCLGHLYREMNLIEKAIDTYEYALVTNDKLIAAYEDISELQEDMGQIANAVTTLLRLSDVIEETRESVYLRIAEIYEKCDNIPSAISYLNKILATNPNNPEALTNMAICHLQSGYLSDALTFIKKSLRIAPNNSNTLTIAAMVYEGLDDYESAYESYLAIFDTDNYNEAQCQAFIGFLYRWEQYSELIDFANESLDIHPHHPIYCSYLAAAYFRINMYNRLRPLLPYVDSLLVRDICPELAAHPTLSALLPPDDYSSDYGHFTQGFSPNDTNK